MSPVDQKDQAMLREETGITTAFVERNADGHVFDDPQLFPELKNVALTVEASNLENLKTLSEKFPQLQCITLRQKAPLSDDGVKYLSCFRHLKSLELACAVVTPALLLRSLPAEIEQLELRDCNISDQCEAEGNRLNLPHLRELTIEHGRLATNFLQALCAPGLRRLCLFGVEVEEGAFQTIGQYKDLRELNVAGSTVAEVEYKSLANLHAAIIDSRSTRYGGGNHGWQ